MLNWLILVAILIFVWAPVPVVSHCSIYIKYIAGSHGVFALSFMKNGALSALPHYLALILPGSFSSQSNHKRGYHHFLSVAVGNHLLDCVEVVFGCDDRPVKCHHFSVLRHRATVNGCNPITLHLYMPFHGFAN